MLSIVGLFLGCDRPDRYSMYAKDMTAGLYIHDSKTGKVYIMQMDPRGYYMWDPVSNELIHQKVNYIDKRKED